MSGIKLVTCHAICSIELKLFVIVLLKTVLQANTSDLCSVAFQAANRHRSRVILAGES